MILHLEADNCLRQDARVHFWEGGFLSGLLHGDALIQPNERLSAGDDHAGPHDLEIAVYAL